MYVNGYLRYYLNTRSESSTAPICIIFFPYTKIYDGFYMHATCIDNGFDQRDLQSGFIECCRADATAGN